MNFTMHELIEIAIKKERAKAFDEGWSAHFQQWELQKIDPSHPITDTNPYR